MFANQEQRPWRVKVLESKELAKCVTSKSCVCDWDWGQMLPLSTMERKFVTSFRRLHLWGSFGCTVVGYDWPIVSKGNSWSIIAFVVLPNDLRSFWHLCGESLYSACSLWSSDFPFHKRSVSSFVTQPWVIADMNSELWPYIMSQ